MGTAYFFEIKDEWSKDCCFSYFDTEEHLADFLFEYEKVDVTVDGEFGADDDPYRIILCHVPRNQRQGFLRALGMLPELMLHVGRMDYDQYCHTFMMDADQYLAEHKTDGKGIPLQ